MHAPRVVQDRLVARSPAPQATPAALPQLIGNRNFSRLLARRKDKKPTKPKKPPPTEAELVQAAIDQAALSDAEREKLTTRDTAHTALEKAKQDVADVKARRKNKKITTAEAATEKAPLIKDQQAAQKVYNAALTRVSKNVKAKQDMETALVAAFPQHAADPRQAVVDWFSDIKPNATFLGHKISGQGSACPGVHKELLERLEKAEAKLKQRLEKAEDTLEGEEKAKKVEEKFKAMSLKIRSVGGLRPPSPATGGLLPSYHCFGLAIDIDPGSNPFARWDTHDVLKRATLLMTGTEYKIVTTRNSTVSAQYDDLRMASDALRDYFALLGKDEEAKKGAEARIEAQLRARPGAGTPGEAAEWKETIEADLKRLKGTDTWKRGDPTKTMMSLEKDLVLALTHPDGGGLLWGGTYSENAGGKDIMHFDWRGGSIQ